jgi:hypothetical protein
VGPLKIKIPIKNPSKQFCAVGFNSDVKGLMNTKYKYMIWTDVVMLCNAMAEAVRHRLVTAEARVRPQVWFTWDV